MNTIAIDAPRQPGDAGGGDKETNKIPRSKILKKRSRKRSGSSRRRKQKQESISAKTKRMMKLKSPFELYHFSLIQFSRNAINPLKLYLAAGRWYNILFLIRLLIFEVGFVSL